MRENETHVLAINTAGDFSGELASFDAQVVTVRRKFAYRAELWGPSGSAIDTRSIKEQLWHPETYLEALKAARRVVHRLGHRYGLLALYADECPVEEDRRPCWQEIHRWVAKVHGTTRLPRSRSTVDILNVALQTRPLPSLVVLRNPSAAIDLFWIFESIGDLSGTESQIIKEHLGRQLGMRRNSIETTHLESTHALRVIPLQGFVGGHRLEYLDVDACRTYPVTSLNDDAR